MEPARECGPRSTAGGTRIWTALFAATLLWFALTISSEINRPWINGVDYNGAVWAQSAHNILRAGLAETSGGSTGFYFGPLPIPPWGYYLHHPPLLHLVIAVLFSIFGEHEWVARLAPIGCSIASMVFLWLLVRSCAGVRAATFSAAIFACLPMQLRYGSMVNFEPCVLMLILAALVCLRRYHRTGRSWWQLGAICSVIVGLWVDWAMYLFVLAASGCWLLRGKRTEPRFAGIILLSAVLSGALYLSRIIFLRPDAWHDLSHTFTTRLGAGKGGYFTELQWLERIGHTLTTHFLPLGLVVGFAGAVILWRARSDENLRWLGRAAFSILVMDLLFVGIFQNDSYIHEYIAFYFLGPIAIAAGMALDGMVRWLQRTTVLPVVRVGGEVTACLVALGIGLLGFRQNSALVRRFRVLDYRAEEPASLIPELGRAIRANFSSDTHVLCNFLPDFGPHLAYYAQRDILNNLSEYKFWDPYLKDHSREIGGVVWVSGHPAAASILAKLPSGRKRFVTIGDLTFCLWKRGDAPNPVTTGG